MNRFITPRVDLADFTDKLSEAWGVGTGFSAAQYVEWCASTHLLLALSVPLTTAEIRDATTLSEAGVDALLPILSALEIVVESQGRFRLSTLGEEYFLSTSVYYIGSGLFWGCGREIPEAYLRQPRTDQQIPMNVSNLDPAFLLDVQRSRNLAAGVAASRSGMFKGISHLIDVGGGAGALAIPIAQDYPGTCVTLVDLPSKVESIREILSRYTLTRRCTALAMDVFTDPWVFKADGILFGNFFHAFSDDKCRILLRRAADSLCVNGRLFVHEVLFNPSRSGPLIAALWNANMRVIGGRQRTAAEFSALLEEAGFRTTRIIPTASHYSLLEATRPD